LSKVRDLEADLAICEAATQGPYRIEPCECGRCDTYFIDVTMSDGRLSKADARFITEARTGWPYAIRRVMELEKELERVRNERDFWDRNEYALGLKVEQLEKELEQREAEIDRLRNELNILQEQLEQRCAQV